MRNGRREPWNAAEGGLGAGRRERREVDRTRPKTYFHSRERERLLLYL